MTTEDWIAKTGLTPVSGHKFRSGDPGMGWELQCSVMVYTCQDTGHPPECDGQPSDFLCIDDCRLGSHCGYPPEAHIEVGGLRLPLRV